MLGISLVFFVIANYFYQAGLIFYDSTLATISTPGNKGRIGGIGIGVGYVGALVGILSALYITETLGFPYPAVFQLTAALFLIFALPCFIFVKETPGDNFWPSLMILMAVLLGINAWLIEYSNLIKYITLFFAIWCVFSSMNTKTTPLFSGGSIIDATSGTFTQLKGTLSMWSNFPGLSSFLVGRVFYTDAANTTITFAAI